ncbi:putative splicing factor 3A subunit [Trifolium repens]|nr:putative splicing factor 3A subunit [Trifolium repens]
MLGSLPAPPVRLPEGITGEELDIIKLTAQFVARNGKSFLTGLTNAYSKVLMPPKGLTGKLKKSSVPDMTTMLERCVNRLEWEHSQEQARQKAEDEIEQERIQMAMIDWHDFVVVESIDFADDEDEELPPPMTLEEDVIMRSKMTVEPGKEVEMEMDEEEAQLVEEGMRAASLEDNDDGRRNEVRVTEDPEPLMRIVKNWKRPEERLPVDRDSTNFVVSPITGELIPINEMSEHMRISLIDPKYKEQKERMFAKIRETTLAQDDEISKNIVGLARTRPDIFGTTEEEVSNAVKAEIEKNDEQPKQVIWDGHSRSIGRTANQAMSQNIGSEDQNDAFNSESKNLPGPAAPPPKPGMPSVRPLPPPPGLALNLPRGPMHTMQYSNPNSGGLPMPPPRPPGMHMMQSLRPAPPPPMQMSAGQHSMIGGQPPRMHPSIPMNNQGIPIPPPPGSQFTPVPRPYVPLSHPPPGMPMMHPPPPPQGLPPPPPEEALPPLPEEPEPKRQKHDDSALIPEDKFLAQHPVCRVWLSVSVPNVDEGNLKGQVLEITVQSLSETVGSLKEKIAGEIQLPANKQKLSGKPGFLKDNMSLSHYNISGGETLSLTLRERGGRKR